MPIDAPTKPRDVDQTAWEAAGKVADAYRRNQEIIARALMAYRSPLEASILTIQSSMVKYLKKEMTAEEFALEVIGAVDNKEAVRAVREATGADSPGAPLSPTEGDAPVSTP